MVPSASGQPKSQMIFSDPRSLSAGRNGWNLYKGADEYHYNIRQYGHKGMILNWLVQDGHHFEQLLRWLKARQAMLYSERGMDLPEPRESLRLRDLADGFWCVLHQISLAIKHAMAPYRSEEQLTDTWIVTEAFRNSSAMLFLHVDAFIGANVEFVEELPDDEIVRSKWAALGVHKKCWLSSCSSIHVTSTRSCRSLRVLKTDLTATS